MLFVLLGVHLVWPALPFKLLRLVELNDDRPLLPLMLNVQELLLLAHTASTTPVTHVIQRVTTVPRSAAILIRVLFLHSRQLRLRKVEFVELASTLLETVKERLR